MTPRCCKTCRYFDHIETGGGRCRRNPPEFLDDGTGEWPWVKPDDWCGSWVNGESRRSRRAHREVPDAS